MTGQELISGVVARRLGAVLRVLRGADRAEVAAEVGVDPVVLGRWCELFVHGGCSRLAGKLDAASFEARDRFVVLLAQELLSPLARIEARLAAGGGDPDVAGEVASLRRVVKAIVTAAAVSVDDLPLDSRPVSLLRLAADAVGEDGAVRLAPDAADVIVIADEDRLRGAVHDLVGAARELAAGEPTSLSVSRQGPYGQVEATIPTACLPPLRASQLFEPEVDALPRSTAAQLFSCRTLVVAHHGDVGVHEDDGATTLWLGVPVDGPGPSRRDGARPPPPGDGTGARRTR